MKRALRIWVPLLGVVSFYPAAALAHTGIGLASGFSHGFLHPLLGLDHLLAMLAVGMLAVQMGGRATWMLPSVFVSFMVLGGILAIAGFHIPNVEAGIMASLLVLGLLLATAMQLPLVLTASIVGVFAVFHGHAHGAEMPLSAGAISYSMGFALTTAMLHLLGMGLGKWLATAQMERLLRLVGGAITMGGIYLAMS